MPSLRSRSTPVLGGVAAAIIAGLVWFGCGRDESALTSPGVQRPSLSLDADVQQGLGPAVAAKQRHSARLFAIPGVVGTAVGLTADGRPAVKIFTRVAGVAGLPQSLDGIPVLVEVTGEFLALQGHGPIDPPPGKGGGGGGGTKIDPTSTFARPVPIGVSTGNEGQCSAGTISARVKNAAGVYALSNNHVYALVNTAPIPSFVLQPGLFDTGCSLSLADTIGRLSAFKTLSFSGGFPATPWDTVDAAIATSNTALLGNATPFNGYGRPNSSTSSASVGQAVQKYGRTTSLTKGTVTEVNATVSVVYSSTQTACFDDQIFVQSSKPFIKPGDSGSLLVTNDANDFPVGLLFAGNSSGQFAVANPIDLALATFSVTVDGK